MTTTHSGDPLVRALHWTLGGLLVASIGGWLVLGGGPGVWAVPERVPAPAVLARGLLLAAALAGALLACESLVRRRGGLVVRAGGLATVWLGLALVMRFVLPPTYIGDWQWILWIVEDGQPLGKWYGASLVYVLFDRAFHLVASASAFSSVRWTSALCGSASVLLWWATARSLGVTRIGRAWPALLLSAFGVVGVGLGHLEVYGAVVLLLSVFLFTAVRLLARPSAVRLAAFALAAGVCLGAYVAMLLLLPLAVGLMLWGAWKLEGWTRKALGAALALALFVLPTLAEHALGPEPIDGQHLVEFWVHQSERAGGALPRAKSFQPPDVYWTRLPHFMSPKYWFSGWHLGDLAQAAWLDDRLGVTLLLLLVPGGLLLRRSAARGPREEWRPLIGPALAAITLLAYGFGVVNGRPYPWDWDLFAWAALPTSLLGAGLLARVAPAGGLGRKAQWLLACVGVVSVLHGAAFVTGTARVPGSFGPASAGLRLGVVPERWEISGGQPVHVWLWLRNETPRPIHVRPEAMGYSLSAGSADDLLRQPMRRRTVVGGRWVPAGGVACLHDFLWKPDGLVTKPRQAGDGDWRAFDAGRLAGRSFVGRFEIVLPDQTARGAGRLESNPITLVTGRGAAPRKPRPRRDLPRGSAR